MLDCFSELVTLPSFPPKKYFFCLCLFHNHSHKYKDSSLGFSVVESMKVSPISVLSHRNISDVFAENMT